MINHIYKNNDDINLQTEGHLNKFLDLSMCLNSKMSQYNSHSVRCPQAATEGNDKLYIDKAKKCLRKDPSLMRINNQTMHQHMASTRHLPIRHINLSPS
jgi:hypothetical protein